MSLHDALPISRVLPYWHEVLAPAIKAGQRVLVAAHGNSLRALVKYLDGISDEAIVELNIPNGVPLVYEFRSEEHTSELQSLMRISYAVFCLNKNNEHILTKATKQLLEQ